MATEAFNILQFLLAQVAAESYLDGIDFTNESNGGALEKRYRQGANHYLNYAELARDGELGMTQSTQSMWDDFKNTWSIVFHQKNTASGFSGTLLKNKITGQYTLSLRSTESKSPLKGGDVVRDGTEGANGQIKDDGFAWGQILDMQKFFEELSTAEVGHPANEFSRHMAVGGKLNVTGYSLGGHLAQVFTQLNYDDVLHTYTINGAGMGTINEIPEDVAIGGQLSSLIQTINDIMTDPLNHLELFQQHHLQNAAVGVTKEERIQWFIDQNTLWESSKTDNSIIYENPLFQLAVDVVNDD